MSGELVGKLHFLEKTTLINLPPVRVTKFIYHQKGIFLEEILSRSLQFNELDYVI